ncbi:MAG: 1-deoxy-D-xylulose-5-phosphate reductoisomerase [Lachnospiraceae bacterium]|nr:1-deoxy-D-xylulose-5-phosphate reductoisomerase [Lachnospiraceae bacterium]
MKTIAILGSTGSIGTQTLDIVRKEKDICVSALSAGKNIDLLEAQVREFKPYLCSCEDESDAGELRTRLADTDTRIVSGMEGLIETATEPHAQVLVTGIVGMIGIRPTIAAIKAGKDIALANKETLVCAGHIIMPLAKECGVRILPVDSEHSAIFQSLNGEPKERLEKILLTASGGPFRGKTRAELENMSLEDALKHPNWSMGRKVTIDSASLCNKGLEVMEAKWLFDVDLDSICVLIHPQSIVHSAVQYVDGAIMAQLGAPDMKLPIQYALYYPDRRPMDINRVDLFELGSLTFEKPDTDTFPGLKLAYESCRIGGSMPTVFNAANEAAVKMLIEGRIRFVQIPEIISSCMEKHKVILSPDVDDILNVEKEVKAFAEALL